MGLLSFARENFRYSNLLFALVLLIFCFGLLEIGYFTQFVRSLVVFYVLAASAYAVSSNKKHSKFILTLGVLGLITQACLIFSPSELTFVTFTALVGVFFWYVTILLTWAIFTTEEVTNDTIFGSVCIYILMGISFSFIFALVEHFIPGSFTHTVQAGLPGANDIEKIDAGFSSFFYFSFVTLTTVGYGDIAPLSELARHASILEGLIGQFYLTVLVARIVSIQLVSEGKG